MVELCKGPSNEVIVIGSIIVMVILLGFCFLIYKILAAIIRLFKKRKKD